MVKNKGVEATMPVWLVTPDFVDYDLYKAAVIVAPTKEVAEQLAFKKFTLNQEIKDIYGDFSQKWTAKEIDTNSTKIVLADYNAG